MSILSTALGFLSPAGTAFKVAPWALVGVLAVGLYVEHERLVAVDAGITTARAQAAEVAQKCQAEASQQAAAVSAATVAQQTKAANAASAAQVQLFTQRSAEQTMAGQVQQALGQQLGTVDTQATQPGHDGRVPLLLGSVYP